MTSPPADGRTARPTWSDGPAISDVERRQYEFEGGGAPSERQAGKQPGWFGRLFRALTATRDVGIPVAGVVAMKTEGVQRVVNRLTIGPKLKA